MHGLRLVRAAEGQGGKNRELHSRILRRRRRLEEARRLVDGESRRDRQRKRRDSSKRHVLSELTFRIPPQLDSIRVHTTSTLRSERDGDLSKNARVFRVTRVSKKRNKESPGPQLPAVPSHCEDAARQSGKSQSLAPLTRHESRALARALDRDGDSVVQGPGYTMQRVDIRYLVNPYAWLNDTVVDAYAKLINARNASFFSSCSEVTADHERPTSEHRTDTHFSDAPPPKPHDGRRKRTHAFGSYFFNLVCPSRARYCYDAVRTWTTGPLARVVSEKRDKGKVRILDYDQLLFPVNVSRCHWVLVVVDIKSKKFVYLDSLRGRDGVHGVVKSLRRWLADEVTDKYGANVMESMEIGSWETVENPVDMPRQKDADSCGMFCLALAESLEAGRNPDYTQDDMELLRKRAALALHTGALPEC